MARTHTEKEERHEHTVDRNVYEHVDDIDRIHELDDQGATTTVPLLWFVSEDRFQVRSAARELERDDRRVVLWQIAARLHRRLRGGEQRHREHQQTGGEADAEGSSGMHGRYYS